MNSAEDFLLLLLHAHSVAAAKTILDYNPMDSATHLADAIVANYVQLPSATLKSTHNKSPVCKDRVHLYAMDLLSLSLIWHCFHDAIREGDWERILRYWKFLVVVFKSSNKHCMQKKALIFWFNTTTGCQTSNFSSYFGAGVSTPGDIRGAT